MELERMGKKPRKSPLWPLLGAVLFFGPGGVTYGFAVGEATRFASDWVYICTPLLVLAGVCLTLGIGRLFDKVGLIIGLVLSLAGLGAAYVNLDGKIAKRQEHRRKYDEYKDLQRFCQGKTQAEARAMAYESGKPGLAPTAVYLAGRYNSGRFSISYKTEFSKWRPVKPYLEDTALVACVQERSLPPLETCHYTGGRSLKRVRTDVDIKLFAVKTGKLVFETRMRGGEPRACGGTEKFYGSYKDSTIPGTVPSLAETADVLRPHVEIK